MLRFFATDKIVQPDGVTVDLEAHDYGAVVMIYGNAERFFPPADVVAAAAAREALRLRLWEQPDAAREKAKEIGPRSARAGRGAPGRPPRSSAPRAPRAAGPRSLHGRRVRGGGLGSQ